MNLDEKFVQAIFNELFSRNLDQYRSSLNKPVNDDKDTYGMARNALAKLDETDRADVVNFLKIVIADSASVILGTLDGVHFPEGLDGDFSVTYAGERIEGDLQDVFIQKAQDKSVY